MKPKEQQLPFSAPDRIYAKAYETLEPFEFNEDVAFVFDDMISRSVPLYGEVQHLCGLLCNVICPDGASIVDLGCSTGTTILEIFRQTAKRRLHFVGVDNSESMLTVCKQKLRANKVYPDPVLVCADLENYIVSQADVALLNYTLQFIAPHHRGTILKRVYDGLAPGGCLILSEKVCHSSPENQDVLTRLHHDFKREQGYSELEISQKRDSLENVLIPLTLEQNIALLRDAGFEAVDVVFKAFTFVTLLARKAR